MNLLVDIVGLHPHLEHVGVHQVIVALNIDWGLAHVLDLQTDLDKSFVVMENQVHNAADQHLRALQKDALASDCHLLQLVDAVN